MATLLAADIGGTKTLIQLQTVEGEVVFHQEFASSDFASFDDLLGDFLRQLAPENLPISSACLAIAGPVADGHANVTNLPWQISADALCRDFDLQQVLLINDFAAVGEGIACLTDDDLLVLQDAEPDSAAPRAVIGAGTGLGQAFLTPQADGWQVWATEGGHCDFAPNNATQQQLLTWLFSQYQHVSYERLVSGMGLEAIYQFIAQQTGSEVINLSAADVSLRAQQGEPLAEQTWQLFIDIYGAQAGNLALTVMPRGGLYLAGGIAAKNQPAFVDGRFIQAFLAKGRMQSLLTSIPVYLIKATDVGLRGAALLAQKALYNNSL